MDAKKASSHSDWIEDGKKSLRGEPSNGFTETTLEGISLKPLYTAADTKDLPNADTLPGLEPFVRGPQATMYTQRPWTVRQYAGFATAEESNAFYKEKLAQGEQGISVAFDLATHRGYDSDHPSVEGDVGKAGVAVDSVEDMKTLFNGIPLDKVSVSMTMNGAVLPILAAFIVAAEEQGVRQDQLAGTIQNDILKEFLVRNTYIYPPGPSMKIVGDVMEYTTQHMPKFNSVSISGYHIQEAGASPALELALTLADGKEYVRAAVTRGMEVDNFAGRLSFFFGVGMNFFLEVAKLRASRLLWSMIMTHFGAKKPRSKMLRMHCQTSGYSLAAQDPYNNVVRTTIEAMAAVFGGTQSLHTNSFDEALALPSDSATRIARNTQLILQEETGISYVIDPWGGSYMMEKLTQDMAEKAWSIMEEIEAMGGMTAAIETGWAKRQIDHCATESQSRVDRGESVIVGVNKYQQEQEGSVTIREIDQTKVRQFQTQRLAQIRVTRDSAALTVALSNLTKGAQGGKENLLDLAIQAMRLRATVGEVSAAMEKVFGRYQAKSSGVRRVYGTAFSKDPAWLEILEDVQRFRYQTGRAPRILIAKLGQDGHDRGSKVVASAFADMGFDVEMGPLFETPEDTAARAIQTHVHVVGVSTMAGAHKTLVPRMIQALRTHNAGNIIAVVGGVIPARDRDFLQQAGVQEIFGPGTPLLLAAKKILERLLPMTNATPPIQIRDKKYLLLK